MTIQPPVVLHGALTGAVVSALYLNDYPIAALTVLGVMLIHFLTVVMGVGE